MGTVEFMWHEGHPLTKYEPVIAVPAKIQECKAGRGDLRQDAQGRTAQAQGARLTCVNAVNALLSVSHKVNSTHVDHPSPDERGFSRHFDINRFSIVWPLSVME